MQLTHEEINALKSELTNDFDNRYVLIDDCTSKQEANNRKFANDDKRIEILMSKVNTFEKLLWVIATAVIGVLATSVLGLIFK